MSYFMIRKGENKHRILLYEIEIKGMALLNL